MKVTFVREHTVVSVNSSENLRKVARKNGIQVYPGLRKFANCHGMGMCGTCVVEVVKGMEKISPMARGEEKILESKGLDKEKYRLSCQCQIHGDVEIKTLS